jgi:uncharacterized membrane protein
LRSFVVFVVSLIVTTRVYENRKNLEREMRSSSSSEVYRVSYQKGRVQKGKKKRDCVHSWDSFVSFSSISKRGILSTVLAVMPSSSDSSQSTGIKKRNEEKGERDHLDKSAELAIAIIILGPVRDHLLIFIYTLSIRDDGPTRGGQHSVRQASATSSAWKPRPSHRLRYWNGHVMRNSNEPSYLSWKEKGGGGGSSRIQSWTQLYAHVTVNDLLPTLQDLFFFFFLLFFFIFIFFLYLSISFGSVTSLRGEGDSSRYNQNQTHRTDWEKWQKGKNTEGKEEEEKKKWFFSYLF